MIMPDYDNSILSVISSVLRHFEIPTDHKSIDWLDNILCKKYENVIVMLFDGLGDESLKHHLPEDSFLRKNQKDTISSLFPSTTTAGTISMGTGLSPIEHGWLGWSLYFKELDENINVYPNTISGGDGQPAAKFHVANKYIRNKTIFTKIANSNNKIKTYSVSPFSQFKTKNLKEITNTVEQICKKEGRKYIYTYWYQPDALMHDNGTNSKIVQESILEINDKVKQLANTLHNSVIIITADHGLIDTTWKFIDQYPKIKDCLVRKPSIESRALTFFVKENMRKEFETLFEQNFGEHYHLMSKNEVLESKLFGNGVPHPRSVDFIGDYIAVATSDVSIECNLAPNHAIFKAAHAGLTKQEMKVPLIVIEKEK